MRSLKECLEIKGELANEIKDLADSFKQNDSQWKGDEEKLWEQRNREYDENNARIAELERIRQKANAQAVHELGDRMEDVLQGRGDVSDLQGHRHSGNSGAIGKGDTFKDANGNAIQAKLFNEPLVDSPRLSGLKEVDTGRLFTAMLTGDVSSLTPSEMNAVTVGSDSDGGYMVPGELSRRLIDLARPQSVAMRAGAQTLAMNEESLSMVRVVSDPDIHWRPETQKVVASKPAFDKIKLEAKTVACIVPISIEAMEGARNIVSVITQLITARMALAIDQAILKGAGARDPLGIRNLDGVNEVTSVGTPTDYNHVSNAVGKIMANNYARETSSLAWISHPRDDDTLDQLVDNTGQPLRPTPRAAQVQRFATTSINTDEGGGSNESFGVVGDFRQVVVGMRTDLRIRIATDGTVSDGTDDINATSQLMRFFVAYMRLDVGYIRPNWLSLMTGITNS